MGKHKMTADQMRKLGGETKFKRVGSEGMAEMGRKGGNKLYEMRGSEYYKKIRQIGIDKKKRSKESPIDRFSKLLTGE